MDPDNPYSPPQTVEPFANADAVLVKVADPTTLGRICVLLLIAATLIDLAGDFLAPMLPSGSPLLGLLSRFELISTCLLFAYIVVFLCWNYRVLRNAARVSPGEMTVSPAMGVGSYFIPILNFWVPAKALLQASRITGTSSCLVLVWWIVTQALLILAFAYGFWLFSDHSITAEMIAGDGFDESRDDWIISFLTVMDLVVAALEIPLILCLSGGQHDWAQRAQTAGRVESEVL